MSTSVTPGVQKSPLFRVRGRSDYTYGDTRLSPEQTETLENVNLTETGTALRRYGYDQYNANQITESAVAKDVTGLASLPFKAGTEFASFAGTKFYEETGASRTDRTGTLTLTDNAELRWRIVFLQDSMVATNGTDETVRWTGSGNATDLTASANVPFTKCKDLVVHQNLLVALRPTVSGTDHTTRVMWCDINPRLFTVDITNFPDDNRADVYDQGAPIVGGADFGGFLYVVKEDGVYQCKLQYDSGFVELNVLQAIPGFEPIATNSILTRVGNPSFLWFVARDGAYIVNPDNSFVKVTEQVQNTWNGLNQSRLVYAVSWIRRKDKQVRTLLSSGSNSTGHDRIMVYDWDTGDVWFDKPGDAMGFGDTWVVSNTEYDMLGSADGYIHQGNDSNQGQDDGTDITATIKGVPNDLGLPGRSKNIINLITFWRTPTSGEQQIEYKLYRDEGSLLTVAGNATVGRNQQYDSGLAYDSGLTYGGGANFEVVSFINRDAKVIAPEFTTNDAMELQSWQIEFEVTEP